MSEFKVGDTVVITGTRYQGQGRTAGSVVELSHSIDDKWFFSDALDVDGWVLFDGEFRHLTKLEKALR